jgi:WD40 repeat protein
MRCFMLMMVLVASLMLPVTGTVAQISADTLPHIEKLGEIKVQGGLLLGDRLVWMPDSQGVAVVHEHEVLLYSVMDFAQAPQVLFQSERSLQRIAFTADFVWMAVASGDAGEDIRDSDAAQVDVIELATGRLQSRFQLSEAGINALAFHAENNRLIVVDGDYNFSMWDVETAQQISHYETHQPGWPLMTGAVFTDDGFLLALGTGGAENQRTIWDTATGEKIAHGAYGYSAHLSFSPDKTILTGASRYGGWTHLWHLGADGDGVLVDHTSHYVLAADFSPDGSLFAQVLYAPSDAQGYRIQFWNPLNGEDYGLLRVDEAVSDATGGMALLFSPDGKWLAVYNAVQGIQLWGMS